MSASSSAILAAPSSGSVTTSRKLTTTRRAHPTDSLSPRARGPGSGGRVPSPHLRWRPLEARLAGVDRLVEAAHRRPHGRLVNQVRIFRRLPRDLDHRVAELGERLLRLRL